MSSPSGSGDARQPEFDVTIPELPDEDIVVRGDDLLLRSEWRPPALSSAPASEDWSFEGRETEPFTIAGSRGTITRDRFVAPGLRLDREVWVADDEPAVSIRQRLTNAGDEPIEIEAFHPLACTDAESLRLDEDADEEAWDVLLQRRYKNDIPQPQGFPDDAGEHTAEQFALFQPRGNPDAPATLLGSPDWRDHFTEFRIDVEDGEAGGPVSSLLAECELDGVRLDPGGERTSRWIELRQGPDAYDLVETFADRVGRYNGVETPPEDPPAVMCTWYFFRDQYGQGELEADLEALADNRMPFDVFLIDNSWNLGEFGDFTTLDNWDRGMDDAADRIREHGYTPGIWDAPYLIDPGTDMVEEHPEWLLTDSGGERINFYMNDADHWVLDPTVPGACDYLEREFRRVAEEWGFEYCKFDFMRAVFEADDIDFHDPTKTRFEAYRMGLAAIRRGVGPDTYVSVCGGHYEASLGLADSQRSGSDVGPEWVEWGKLRPYRQNIYRNWMNRLWHTDADAATLRDREEPYLEAAPELSHGQLSDVEARTDALNQYLCGGISTFTEYFPELGERRELYRHLIPTTFNSPRPLDPFTDPCANYVAQRVEPRCDDLDPWRTVGMVNHSPEESLSPEVTLSGSVIEGLAGDAFLVTTFFGGEVLGVFERGETVDLEEIPPHGSELLRVTTWDGDSPVLAGTDSHFTGGGVEIENWSVDGNAVSGSIRTDWEYPIEVSVAYPDTAGDLRDVETVSVDGRQRTFSLRPR